MKILRLIVSLRLALFPLIFNLSFAQDVEIGPENDEQISPTPLYQEGQNTPGNEEKASLFPLDKGDTALAERIGEKNLQDPQNSSANASEGRKVESFGTNDNEVKNLMGQENSTQDSSLRSEGQENVDQFISYSKSPQSPSESFSDKDDLGDFQSSGEETGDVSVGEILSEVDSSLYTEGQINTENNENILLGGKEVDRDENPQTEDFYAENEELLKNPQYSTSSNPAPFSKGVQLDEDTQDFSLYSEGQNNPNLKITEVYWLGSKEWVEVTNFSDSDFFGELVFSGANSKGNNPVITASIPSYSSIIFGNANSIADMGMLSGNINKVSPSMSIPDTGQILIDLVFSGNEIDIFYVDQSTVAGNYVKSGKPRPSFHIIYDERWDDPKATVGTEIFNITGNHIANPGKVIIQSGNPWEGEGPSGYPYDSNDSGTGTNSGTGDDLGSGDITGGTSDFNLIISEVFYDGEDEWIEIFNIGSGDFDGDLELSGTIFSNDQTNQIYNNIHISSNDFLILADSKSIFQNINVIQNGPDYPDFFIPDTDKIQISLLLSGNVIDSFYAHEYRVNKHKGKLESFHKILTPTGFVVTRALFSDDEDMENLSQILEEYITATPGKLSSTYEDTVKDYSQDPNENTQPSDPSEGINCDSVEEDIITISEIFWGGSRYEPFIELSIHEDIEYEYDSLWLSGDLLVQPLSINLDEETITYDREKLQKNTKLILTTKAGSLTEAGLITIILQPNLSFNYFSGELELYGMNGQSRQLLDIVKINTGSLEKSNYHIGSLHSCGDNMDNIMDFSPGFDESALKYFSVTSQYNEKVIETIKYVGGGGGCSCPSKKDLCGENVQTGISSQTLYSILSGNTQDSSADESAGEGQVGSGAAHQNDTSTQDSSLRSEGQNVKIVSLEPKTPESITLQSFLPYDIDFNNHNYYLKTSTATTKKYIDGILYANTIDTFIKSFGFLDSGACVYLYSGDNQLDSYCYSSNTSEKEQKEEKPESFNPSDYQISITHINYDPEGSDSGNETITIKSNSSKAFDLSKIKMKVNATTKKISGTLEPYSSITLKGSFGFPNSTKDGSDVVVILFYENHIFSTYTYNPNKPKIEIPDGAVKVYSVIDGDTFRYRKEDGNLQSVRLLGVDAPESNTARYRTTECFGKEAKNYLTNLIKNQYVTLEYDPNSSSSDAYGRMLAYVYLDGKLVNETLIAEGYAKEYTYKTAYSYQSDFKQAEAKAKKSEKGLRSSSICGKSIAEEPDARGIDYEKLSIKISNIIYDPDGTDSGNEIVQLSVDNSQVYAVSSLDFSDDFSLTIFPRSEYSTGTTKSKKLSEFGLFDLSLSSDITLKGNFGLPNNRATCVSLNQGNYTFDTRCYNPNQPLSEEETLLSGDSLIFKPNIKIQSITPNPSGKDSGKEEITLLWTVNEDIQNSLESQTTLDLSSAFSLLINGKTKKKLVGTLIPNQTITIKGSFGLPNSASCVSLIYSGIELDKFCYGKASDGVKFNSDNTSVHEISAEELAIVKKITLIKQGDKLCTSYNKTLFTCKSIPNSTTEKNKKQLSMQNTFISELENYIKSNYSMIYYNSEIKDYFSLYSEAKKAIKSGSGDFTWGEQKISITDISGLFQTEYEQGAKSYFVAKILSAMSDNISSALLQAEDEYYKKWLEKSDLSFLSLAR